MARKRGRHAGVAVPNLEAWRIARYLLQKDLASAAGVNVATISRIENGRTVALPTIVKLAQALQVTPDQLLYEEPKRHPKSKPVLVA